MDAQMAIAIFTALAAFAALWTAITAFRQVKITCQSISVDALLRLDAYFNSPDMKATRKKAASFLLQLWFKSHYVLPDTQNKCRIALDDLLDFFEGIAFLSMKKKAHQTLRASGASSLATLTTTCMQRRDTSSKRKRKTQCSGRNLFAFTTDSFALSKSIIIGKAMNLPMKRNSVASLKMRQN